MSKFYGNGVITDVLIKMLEEAKQTAKDQLEWDEAIGPKNAFGKGSVGSGILGAIYDNGFEERNPRHDSTGNSLISKLLFTYIGESTVACFPKYKSIAELDEANVKEEIMRVFDFAIAKAKEKDLT